MTKYVTCIWIAVFLAVSGFSQEFRGTVSGAVMDPASARVPAAKIVATETSTGTKVETISDSSGQYSLPFLSPGDYDISVKASGFKEYVRKAVHVGSGDHPVIDIPLEVGNATQTVEVTAEVSLINSENASVGQAITTKEVEDLPLNGRTPLVLASLSIGVVANGQPSLIHPFDSAAASGWNIAGGAQQTNEIQVDGAPDATWDGRLAYSPPTDAVQEVRVKAFDSDASFGHTSGGTMNQVLKTGTNSLHGSAWEFNQPNTLIANNFFNNKNNLGNPVTHYNQYGVTAGGPLMIPKLYDGRNKLFWFFAWEGLKDSQPNTTLLSVATDKERTGDFSELLALKTPILIYDPYSATLSGTTVNRTPYAGNLLPATRLSSIAQNYLKLMPASNLPGQAGGFNNFGSTAGTPDNYSNELGRIDYNMSTRNRLFFDARHTDYIQTKNNYFNNITTGSTLVRENWGMTLDDVYTINPSNVVDIRANFTRMGEAHPSPSAGFDPTSIGFPSYMSGASIYPQLPNVTFASTTGFTTLGSNAADSLPSQSLQLFGTWASNRGNHALKFGGELRQYVLNTTSFANSAGNLGFTANSWVRASSTASSTVAQGQDLAEFLLGLPTSGSFDINTAAGYFEHYGAVFAQDDWRVRRNLTINLGLRFDYDAPYREKYNRTVNGFDTTSPSPLAAAAVAAYAKSPIAQIPVGSFNVLGGLTYPSEGGALYEQTSHKFSPRIGTAWTPDFMHGKMVIRAGFAIFVQPMMITQLDVTGKFSTKPVQQQYGFSQTTQIVQPSNFLSPAATLANPFPTGIKAPAGSSQGLGTFAGQTVQFIDPQVQDPYSARWNFDIQHSFSPNTLLEVAYVGSHGVHLPMFITQLNTIPRQYLSTVPVRDQATINTLGANVTNPFSGLNTSQNTGTATVAQLLSRFPQFPAGTGSGSSGVIELDQTAGQSYYQSLNVRFQKRLSSGLTITGNYIFSKTIERILYLNDTDPAPEKRISPFDHPHRFVVATVYEIPVGRGRHFNVQSRWLDAVIGGFAINSIYTYQTGGPIPWVNGSTTTPGDYVYFGDKIVLNNRETNTAAFNTSAFDVKSTEQFQYHIRTFSTTFPSLRADGINEWSPSVTKRISFTERASLQLRAEAYNVFNHPTFTPPNTTATNAGFGTITTQANRTRTIQLGARFVF
jgi:Carboxypeptidase regulatory-like domain